ncbi:hypothetical protein BFW01_g353 [Lasiodiplodia theobromae]|uniref:Uncharacterized protein n=1 Tax=Lasiodiplodia theobromae TaxID=45133 RepID=A0A5N5CTJ6_9PEZI|nr:hypothetical protein DBV05_g12655 [Lasiodiplodia theobromae]KAF9630172.1 hypothetical protein BFW01_g353 [Lasiodiplodia theobromae]
MKFATLIMAAIVGLAAAAAPPRLLTRNGVSAECPNGCLGSGSGVTCCSCPGGIPGCYNCADGSDADCSAEVTE